MYFTMEQCVSTESFFDSMQWFMGSLREGQSKCVHYLDNNDGCGAEAEKGIRKQFFKIIERILFKLNTLDLTGQDLPANKVKNSIVHMINAVCCWDYKLNDHDDLAKLNVFQTLLKPNNEDLHPISLGWGQESSYCVPNADAD